jgi:hypothetical protein
MRDLQDAGKQITKGRSRYNHLILICVLCACYCPSYHHGVDFFFSAVLAPLNSEDYLTGVSRKENILSLCVLCVFREAPQGRDRRAVKNILSLTRIAN